MESGTSLLNDSTGAVAFWENAVPSTLAQDLALPWQPEKINMRGRLVDAPRKTLAYGDPGVAYTYAGQTKQALPWPPHLKEKKERVEALTGRTYNFALGNFYEDGAAHIGWHADKTGDLAPGSWIASTSDGATRDFEFRVRDGRVVKRKKFGLALRQGMLLTMDLVTQDNYKHRVPPIAKKKRATVGARINWTFRLVTVKRAVVKARGPIE